jgi:hypothetical protein
LVPFVVPDLAGAPDPAGAFDAGFDGVESSWESGCETGTDALAGTAGGATNGFRPIDAERYVISGFKDAARSYTEVDFGEPLGTRYPCRISSLSR